MSEPTVPPSTPPPSSGGSASSNRSLMLVLAYLGPLALIPLLTEKEDKEVQWHSKHGLVLFGAWIVFMIVVKILQAIFLSTVAGCGVALALAMLLAVVGIAYLVVTVICIVKAINGQRFTIPGISQFADKF